MSVRHVPEPLSACGAPAAFSPAHRRSLPGDIPVVGHPVRVGPRQRMARTTESRDDFPTVEIPVLPAQAPGRHRDPTGAFVSPSTEIEQQCRLDRRRIHSLSVAVFAGAVIMVFGVTALLRPDHHGWLALAVGFAVVAVATLVLVLDPPRKKFTLRRGRSRRER